MDGQSQLTLARIDDRRLLKVWANCFPPGEFETISLIWMTSQLKANAMSRDHGLICRLTVPKTALLEFEVTSTESICVFAEPFESSLDFGLRQRPGSEGVSATWRLEGSRLKVKIDVEKLGSLTRTLGHVPDALLPPPRDPDFGEAASLSTKSVKLLKEVYEAFPSCQLIQVAFSKAGISFADADNKADKFEPNSLTSRGNASTLMLRSLLDYASRAAEHTEPDSLELQVIDRGFLRAKYSYAYATLEYLLASAVEGE